MHTQLVVIFVFLCVFISISLSEICSGDISQDVYDGLEALFLSTGGNNWKWSIGATNTHWTFPSALDVPCSVPWQGVSCNVTTTTPVACEVNLLHLREFGLMGALPSQFGLLSTVVFMALSFNNITGPKLFLDTKLLVICNFY